MLKGRGGPGRGQGNKPLPPEVKKSSRIMVNLDEATAAEVERLRGDRKASEWVREAIREKIAREQSQSTD